VINIDAAAVGVLDNLRAENIENKIHRGTTMSAKRSECMKERTTACHDTGGEKAATVTKNTRNDNHLQSIKCMYTLELHMQATSYLQHLLRVSIIRHVAVTQKRIGI
jgi:hypothetical protein